MDEERDVLDVADRLWTGADSVDDLHPITTWGGLAEVADGVAFTPSFANVSAVDTDDGLVLVDTGSALMAGTIHRTLRTWSSSRLHTAVYSHGHIDHVFGVPVWEDESAGQGWEPPRVVAHEALPPRFDRYIATAGYNQIINRRQFGIDNLVWPTEYRYPDETYRDHLDLTVGGRPVELHHARGETDDHTWTWFPDRRVLCCGDLFIWASPNAGNPQKVQRYPREWADALREMLRLFDRPGGGPEVLLPGHGFPVVGADRVRQALTDTAVLLESLVDQTVALMNAGARLDEAVHTVTPPPELLERPYLRPVYDEPEFIVHTIWRQYGGWWDGNPASLKPAREVALAAELAELAGGAGTLADRALELLDRSGAGGADTDALLRLAGHLSELAWLAAPDDPAIRETRRAVFSRRSELATSTMATGVFAWAARESGPRPPAPSPHAH
jgi:alkyl sulfatase BDS1-like metallo-beta-lactamase superfamily hydrolase